MKNLIEAEVLAGYVLEEALAALLRDNGYLLLVDESQDKEALENEHHGLTVRGRGANHQVDMLGQLEFSIPFSLPIRLFAEAKFKKPSIGIADVRNALGLVNDVNERFAADAGCNFPLLRYHYRYALFSTSGFSPPAQRFALTHQISLIDLQGPAFSDLRGAVKATAASLRRLATFAGLTSFPIEQMRVTLRKVLGTWTLERERTMSARRELLPERGLREIAVALHDELQSRLIFGFPQGSFVLVLQPDNPEKFEEFLANSQAQVDVDIKFASGDFGKTGEWAIVPDGQRDLILRFGLPPLLEEWLLTGPGTDLDRVEQVKNYLLPHITVFHHHNRILQLRYHKVPPPSSADVELRDDSSELRNFLADPDLAYGVHRQYAQKSHTQDSGYRRIKRVAMDRPMAALGRPLTAVIPEQMAQKIDIIYAEWSIEGIMELLRRLGAAGSSWQGDVLREASNGEGEISAERIYATAGKAGPGVLSGLNRRVNNIWRRMQAEEGVQLGLQPPLTPLYRGQHLESVTHYAVPKEFVRLLGANGDTREPSR